MDRISIREIVKAIDGELLQGNEDDFITGVKHDSRECSQGDLFAAVKGENQDGHKYIPNVVEKGCRTLLISCSEEQLKEFGLTDMENINIIKTEDTVYALGELAKYYLGTLDVIKVAVTGSVGKTSVRDMIYYVLSEKYNCGRNMKNFNNDIGLPLSIFQFDSSMETVVLEMGMSGFGEIDRLAEIVKPHIGVITNIGISHIENLGSREGIFKAKMEIADHITSGCITSGNMKGEGVLVFANDGEYLTKETTLGDYRQVSVGTNGKSDYIISSVDDFGLDGIQFTLEHLEESRRMKIPVPGIHNAVNSALAVAVGELLGVSKEEAGRGLMNVNLTGSRLKQLKNDRVCVIDDTYNASPDSMKSALKVLERTKGYSRKIAILGDMYELGSESLRQHFGVGVFARGLDVDAVIAIGEDAAKIYEGACGGKAKALYYESKSDFYKELDEFIEDGDIILVKGSRGMKMEEIVENILKH